MSPFPERLPTMLEDLPREVRHMLTDKLFDQQLKLRGGIHRLIEAMYRGTTRGDKDHPVTVSYSTPAHACWDLMLEDTTAFLKKRDAIRDARRQQEIEFPSSETSA